MRIFSKYTWRFPSNKKEIFLTFDDGPTPEITEFVLDELKKYNAKATFFCIGKNIKNHPDIFDKIVSEGHSIGNHTQNHLKGWKTNSKNYIENVLECENIILSEVKKSQQFKLFRPPYGKIKKNQAKKLLEKKYKIIMWDVLSADFDTTISKEKCLQNVLKNTTKGSIIVFHDSIKAAEKMQYALPIVLKEFSEKGFIFKAI
ncbi:polysaccharide deacetylase family protein [Polaribacter sp. Z022]|uniref:polysaccharide deacetylase family protein n=1 Tax=Polaribacter sp. Z022 TaxID=2927125 RepID=UPI002021AF3A|nr:polysaccharide deacetylase family protein [Polaribacter sp. Z022]MCL7752197.1 polysaccharide deacetylase family protein [Polaribacter sp. Z022]